MRFDLQRNISELTSFLFSFFSLPLLDFFCGHETQKEKNMQHDVA